jgi:hypothetical protein
MRIVEDGVAGRMIGAARAMGCGEGTTPGWRAPRVTRIVTDPACVITDLPHHGDEVPPPRTAGRRAMPIAWRPRDPPEAR